ncbi:hypothetical protein Ddye_010715 [Dipteronia dyeriana]|uniref:Uncharacterized protein n=1 Tax=Dipteronia dyeriana TaxID=168575 RepID=A0AAD9XE20_9ROSI|nr:hypothetical protein Ddye_010715 [Dipteronia dyeriana]
MIISNNIFNYSHGSGDFGQTWKNINLVFIYFGMGGVGKKIRCNFSYMRRVDKDKVVVIGDGVDAATLVRNLSKKVGFTYLLLVEEVKEKQKKKRRKKRTKRKMIQNNLHQHLR